MCCNLINMYFYGFQNSYCCTNFLWRPLWVFFKVTCMDKSLWSVKCKLNLNFSHCNCTLCASNYFKGSLHNIVIVCNIPTGVDFVLVTLHPLFPQEYSQEHVYPAAVKVSSTSTSDSSVWSRSCHCRIGTVWVKLSPSNSSPGPFWHTSIFHIFHSKIFLTVNNN